jgi:hypothetical protein
LDVREYVKTIEDRLDDEIKVGLSRLHARVAIGADAFPPPPLPLPQTRRETDAMLDKLAQSRLDAVQQVRALQRMLLRE